MNKTQFYSLAGALLACASLCSSAYAIDERVPIVDTGPTITVTMERPTIHNIFIVETRQIFDVRPAILRSSPGFTYPRILLTSAAHRAPAPKINGKADPLLKWRSRFVA